MKLVFDSNDKLSCRVFQFQYSQEVMKKHPGLKKPKNITGRNEFAQRHASLKKSSTNNKKSSKMISYV